MTTILDVLTWINQITASSREVDIAIWEAVEPEAAEACASEGIAQHINLKAEVVADMRHRNLLRGAPKFTSNTDQAIALVPEEARVDAIATAAEMTRSSPIKTVFEVRKRVLIIGLQKRAGT